MWFIETFTTSVGKKLLMAVTGLCFCAFLVIHLFGNLTLYGGSDMFNAYVQSLHAYDPAIKVAEWVLLTLALVHITTGLILFIANFNARPVRYQVNKSAGGRTVGSWTMPYTGFLLLCFVILHLMNFHFVDTTHTTLFAIVAEAFSQPAYVLIYILAVVIAAIHVSHGFWSAFQTVGANHPKYMPFIRGLSLAFSLIVGAGFGFIPIYMSLIA